MIRIDPYVALRATVGAAPMTPSQIEVEDLIARLRIAAPSWAAVVVVGTFAFVAIAALACLT